MASKNLAMILVVLFSSHVFAQTRAAAPELAGVSTKAVSRQFFFTGGIKSYSDSARIFEYDNPQGRQFRSKNEVSLGFRTNDDWGAYGLFVHNSQGFGNFARNQFGPADPSINLLHPVFRSEGWRMTGQFRQYFPLSEGSVRNQSRQSAYTSYLSGRLGPVDMNNALTFRMNFQPRYANRDWQFYAEDFTTFTRFLTPWLRMGLGQHTQFQTYAGLPTGYTMEVYPLADVILSPTVFLGPRVFLPLAVQNAVSVNEAPSAVSTTNVQFELFLQATL